MMFAVTFHHLLGGQFFSRQGVKSTDSGATCCRLLPVNESSFHQSWICSGLTFPCGYDLNKLASCSGLCQSGRPMP